MRRLARAVALALLLAACTRSGPDELLSTAQLEEKQRNLEHARKLYGEIVERYPDSPEAAEAKKRLAALGAQDAAPAQ